MTTSPREGAERQTSEGPARVYVVHTATNSAVDAFFRQTGIDVRAEMMQPAPQPTPVHETTPLPMPPQAAEGAQILAFPAHPSIGEVATGGYQEPAAEPFASGSVTPLDGVRHIEDFPEIERPMAA